MKDKVVIITGSSRGMGAATAKLIQEQGGKVVLHGKSETAGLMELAKKLKAAYITCDITDKAEVMKSVETVLQKFGRIDSLINCAGAVKSKDFLELEDQDWYDDFNVNLLGTAHFCQAVIPHMKQGSTIVNVSSIRGLIKLSRGGALPYCVSKAGVTSLTVGLAKEFGPKIRVNCVAPGPTETEMAKGWSAEMREKYKTESLVGRIANPEDIAKVIVFFASEQSGIVTGQILSADGGYELYGK
jgi:3-oxoacyl-[acyl-carrier protein] reductase